MATKLHLATFLQEVRCYEAIADRRPERALLGRLQFRGLSWPVNLPVGIVRRRLLVQMQSESGGLCGWVVPILHVAGPERKPDPAGAVTKRRKRGP